MGTKKAQMATQLVRENSNRLLRSNIPGVVWVLLPVYRAGLEVEKAIA